MLRFCFCIDTLMGGSFGRAWLGFRYYVSLSWGELFNFSKLKFGLAFLTLARLTANAFRLAVTSIALIFQFAIFNWREVRRRLLWQFDWGSNNRWLQRYVFFFCLRYFLDLWLYLFRGWFFSYGHFYFSNFSWGLILIALVFEDWHRVEHVFAHNSCLF